MKLEISAEVHRSLSTLFGLSGAKRCLSIGTTDTSTLGRCLAAALPDDASTALIVTIENDDRSKSLNSVPHCLDAHLAGSDDLPTLTEIINFETRIKDADPKRAVQLYAKRMQEAKQATGPSSLDLMEIKYGGGTFDLVIIENETFVTNAIVKRCLGSSAILFNGTRSTIGGAQAFETLFDDLTYHLRASDDAEHGGWALFTLRNAAWRKMPVHFFTIVQNGHPFIRYHEQVFSQLSFDWHWHIVEGVACLVKDTAWSLASGGHIADNLHNNGRSNDGTSEYLDDLAQRFPNNITIYRKPIGRFWDGKLEMVSAPLATMKERCLLWQIDSDELWTSQQISTMRDMFIAEPDRTAAWFWCNYYVGPNKGISTRYNYAQNPDQEWIRLWRFEPGMVWDSHEPPKLTGHDPQIGNYDVGIRYPFTHAETERVGAVFDHFAYVTVAQARFKESYYGYANAVTQWEALQCHGPASGRLKDYFSWVKDETMFDDIGRLGWRPGAVIDKDTGHWVFTHLSMGNDQAVHWPQPARPRIIVDGIFFQIAQTGIARLWANLLAAWIDAGFADRIVLLDRGGTAPRIDGVIYRSMPKHPMDAFGQDADFLQWICNEEKASLFVSTYYTAPTLTPTVFFGYDMIPEIMGFNLSEPWWKQKHRAINSASGHIMISCSGADDLARFFPSIDRKSILVGYCSVDPVFTPCDHDDLAKFRSKYNIDRDFVLLVGARHSEKDYKNGVVVYAALACLSVEHRPLLICVGGEADLGSAGHAILTDADVMMLKLDDKELRCAYGAAVAYICPSIYEGFGLPCVEAMSVGCPVIACPVSSIPEIAGRAALYFDPRDPASLAAHICDIRDPILRAHQIAEGFRQVKVFDQNRTAKFIQEYLEAVIERDASESRTSFLDLRQAYASADDQARLCARTAKLERAAFDSSEVLSTLSHMSQLSISALSNGSADESCRQIINHVDMLRAKIVRAHSDWDDGRGLDRVHSARELSPHHIYDGLDDQEGPYVEAGIVRAFRWQIKSICNIDLVGEMPGPATINIIFANIEPQQCVKLSVNGLCLEYTILPYQGWDHVFEFNVPVCLLKGLNRVSLEVEKASSTAARSLFIAIYAIEVRRSGDVFEVDSSEAGPPHRHVITIGTGPVLIEDLQRSIERWDASRDRISQTGFDRALMPSCVMKGVDSQEGPYVDLGVRSAFAWQINPVSHIDFLGQTAGPAWIEVAFSNIEPEQTIKISVNGVCLEHIVLQAHGWEHLYVIKIALTLFEGINRLTLEVGKAAHTAARDLYIAIFAAEVTTGNELDLDWSTTGEVQRHTLVIGSPPLPIAWQEASAEVLRRGSDFSRTPQSEISVTSASLKYEKRQVADGFDSQEGPYLDLGVRSAFAWQINPVSHIDFLGQTAGPAWIDVAFSNITPKQTIKISINGVCLKHIVLQAHGWEHLYVIKMALTLFEGVNRLTLEVGKAAHTAARDLYIAVFAAEVTTGGELDLDWSMTGEVQRHTLVIGPTPPPVAWQEEKERASG